MSKNKVGCSLARTKLSRIPNTVPNLSRLTSRCVAVQAVDQNAVDHFDVFACQVRDACCLAQYAPNPFSPGLHCSPRPLVGEWWPSSSHLSLIDAFGVSMSASWPPRKLSRISIIDLWSPYVRALRVGQYARYKHWRRSLLDGRAAAARPTFAPCACGRPYLWSAHF